MQVEFDTFWSQYPRHIAKKAALKAYTQVRKEISAECILASVAIMKETVWRGRKLEWIPYPATFLRAEAFDERSEMLEDETPDFMSGLHLCTICHPPHTWTEEGDPVNWDQRYEKTCPEQIAKMREAIKV